MAKRGVETLSERAADISRALVLVLRSAQAPLIADVRDGRYLLHKIDECGLSVALMRRLILDLSVSVGLSDSIHAREQLPGLLFEALVCVFRST